MSQRRSTRKAVPNTSVVVENEREVDPNIREAVHECARYFVCREGSKIPIKRADIAKHLATICETPSHQVSNVLAEAERLLKKVYGYKLVPVGGKAAAQYVVVLTEECDSLPSSIANSQHRIMLMAALTHVFMSGGTVKEGDMWKFLTEAGLLEENDIAGQKAFTTTFTRQAYLTFSKIGEGDLVQNVFEWGSRAKAEVPKMFVLNKLSEAFNMTPEHWFEQHKQATEELQQSQQAS